MVRQKMKMEIRGSRWQAPSGRTRANCGRICWTALPKELTPNTVEPMTRGGLVHDLVLTLHTPRLPRATFERMMREYRLRRLLIPTRSLRNTLTEAKERARERARESRAIG